MYTIYGILDSSLLPFDLNILTTSSTCECECSSNTHHSEWHTCQATEIVCVLRSMKSNVGSHDSSSSQIALRERDRQITWHLLSWTSMGEAVVYHILQHEHTIIYSFLQTVTFFFGSKNRTIHDDDRIASLIASESVMILPDMMVSPRNWTDDQITWYQVQRGLRNSKRASVLLPSRVPIIQCKPHRNRWVEKPFVVKAIVIP